MKGDFLFSQTGRMYVKKKIEQRGTMDAKQIGESRLEREMVH